MKFASFFLILLLCTPLWAQPERGTPPVSESPQPMTIPPVVKSRLKNGLKLWVVERPGIPIVQIRVVVDAGHELDPKGKFGLASFVADMLTEGAGGMKALELADEVDYLGASLPTRAFHDSACALVWVPTARLEPATKLLGKVLMVPDFPQGELERLRKERLTSLLEARSEPREMMAIALPALLYPNNHRYSVREDGTEAVLKSLTRQDLVEFYSGTYQPSRTTIVVVGDVSAESVKGLVEEVFGSWSATEEPLVSRPGIVKAPQVEGRKVFLIDKPGAAQTVIRIARIGVGRDHPDYFPLKVLNTILGGSFTSRLNQNLREKNGFTYGAWSDFRIYKDPGPFRVGADVATDKTGAALAEFFKELNRIRQPLTAEEVSKAKNYLSYSFPVDYETNSGLAGGVADMQVHDLPADFLETYVQNVQDVTLGQVEKVAQEQVVPDAMIVVLVGDKAKILPQIEALNLGRVEFPKMKF